MKKALLTAALGLILTGCTAAPNVPLQCPNVGLMRGADRVAIFDGTEMPSVDDIVAYGVIRDYRGECTPELSTPPEGSDEKPKITAIDFDIEIDFWAERGKGAGDVKQQSFPYFIALLSQNEDILSKQAFTADLSVKNAGLEVGTEEHHIRFPITEGTSPGLYKIVIGYIMTPTQQAFNEKQNEPGSRPVQPSE